MSVEKIIAAIPSKSAEDRRQMRENAENLLRTGTPRQQFEARAVIAALDAEEAAIADREQVEQAATAERLRGMSRAKRVAEAFSILTPNDTELKVIQALLDNPGSTSLQLTTACGWRAQSWHLHFGMMCERRQAYLWPAKRSAKRDASFLSGILADFDQATATFSMKPDVVEAFEALGIRSQRQPA